MPFKDKEKQKLYQKKYKAIWRKKNPNYDKNWYQKNKFEQRIKSRLKSFKKKTDNLKNQYKLTKLLWDDPVINGCILSDAYLRKTDDGQNSCFELEQSEKNEGLINFLVKYFKDLGIETGVYRYLHKKIREQDEPKWGIRIFTYRSKFWTLMRKRWYPEEYKVIPKDLIITPKTMALIFMGDGNSQWRNSKKTNVIVTLHTQGFDDDSVNLLIKKLNDFGLKRVYLEKKPNGGNAIRFERTEDVKKFMNLVEPFILSCFNYKIKHPTSYEREPYELLGRR